MRRSSMNPEQEPMSTMQTFSFDFEEEQVEVEQGDARHEDQATVCEQWDCTPSSSPPALLLSSSYFTPNAYEEQGPFPPQPTINRGYTAEVTTSTWAWEDDIRDYRDYTDEEYTADSDNEESWPSNSQEDTSNPFEHVPNPEEDRRLAQERQQQRIACKDKLGVVVRGTKFPISADLLEAPSPTMTFGRQTLWPVRDDPPESLTSPQLRSPNLDMPTGHHPIFCVGPAFPRLSTPASAASSTASSSLITTAVLTTQPRSDSTLIMESSKGPSTSTLVTRPAQPNEIQAIYAAIMGRRKVPSKEQEQQSTFTSEGLFKSQNSARGGGESSLNGSEEPMLNGNEDSVAKEQAGVLKECDKEVTLTAEALLQKKLAELGPCNPGSKRRRPPTDECEIEEQAMDLEADEQNGDALLHTCQVVDGFCWSQGIREPTLGIYWFHKRERSLRSVHRRFDKFQIMSSPDEDDTAGTRHHLNLVKYRP
ncbi:hypothetical protein BGZ95_011671 [Linnemannia exigua]|uniref:Uncharacterized protein n=1 Tax=Linnemannia exigua TaxID=604196 RepID=A0AAD4D9K5_9FUNG|nr:hypothetical protein BGZ95_011671 [Linnemannia exigua]